MDFGLELGLGTILAGTIADGDLDTGFAVTLAGSWLAIYESETLPFLSFGVSAGVSRTTGLTAVDLRASVMTGKTFGPVTPYLVARVFGGPVYWDGSPDTGTDAHHFAIGGGASLRLPANLDLFVEGVPLGERSLSAGIGLAF